MNTQVVMLDINKTPASAQVVRIGQGDSAGTTIEAHVYDNGAAVLLTGMSAKFCMKLPDNVHYVLDSDCLVSDNVITYVVDEAHCASVVGTTHEAYFEILDGSTVIYSTGRFSVQVLRAANGSGEGAATWTSEFNEWMTEKDQEYAETMAEKLEDIDEAIDAIGDISELAVPLMSANIRGGAKLGDNLEIDANERLRVKTASADSAGVVKPDGTSITEDADGTIHNAYEYVLPTMGPDTKGGAKLGAVFDIDSDGALNLLPPTENDIGGVKADGTSIAQGADGTLSAEPLTTTQIDDIVGNTAVTSNKLLNGTLLTYLWGKLKDKFAALVDGVVAVSQGGTGKDTHTSNAVLTGNGTGAVNNVATASGALYATEANGASQFGTLPVAQGGTGATTAATARTNLGTPSSSSIAAVEQSTATANHAKDSHFVLDGELKKATAAIASGESITSSNTTSDTLQGQIDTLRDSVANRGDTKNVTFSHYAVQKNVFIRFRDSSSVSYILEVSGGQNGKYLKFSSDDGTGTWTQLGIVYLT